MKVRYCFTLDIEFDLTVVYNSTLDNGNWYSSNDITLSEHTGTHLDAPSHFASRPGIYFTSTIPVERSVNYHPLNKISA